VTPWYEVRGEGNPVVLLHGGLGDSSNWVMQTDALAEHRRVFAYDRRGHGRTPDTDAPLTFDDMAAEAIQFLEEVVGGPAALIGWSDGAIVSLFVSLHRPDLVARQVLIGANFNHNGLIEGFDPSDDPDNEEMGIFKSLYEGIAIDPSHWPVFYAKTMRLWREEPNLTVDDVAKATMPSLVLVGDDEPVGLDHTVALYEALPQGQLAVVPGTSHILTMEKPTLVNRLILDFLAETGPPVTMVPIRRA
jgi:pimeloyl-ACP methyl ester carboxylesterase